MKQSTYSAILFIAIILLLRNDAFTQGIGDHLTMSMENCSYVNAYTIQFDLKVVSDGANTSDLRVNSFNFGINFDTCLLQTGATVTPSYMGGSSYFVGIGLNAPAFTLSSLKNHIRMVEPFFSGSNSFTFKLTVGTKYNVGTFQLTSSANYTACCPNFTLQDTVAVGKTNTSATVWIATDPSTTTFSQTGTANGDRIVNVTCLCPTAVTENSREELISFYPNPVTHLLTINSLNNKSNIEIKIINLLGEIKYSSVLINQHTEINVLNLSSGLYTIIAIDGENIRRYQFIKQ